MIYEVFGLPRAGKTTFLTMLAQRALARKRSPLGRKKYRAVYTNFECEGCYQIDFDSLPFFDFSECLIIIDEISLYADNRKYKSFNDDLLYFFKLHGHYKLDLVWCSQSINDADKKIRDVTDVIFYLRPFPLMPSVFSVYSEISHCIDFKNRQVTDCYDLRPLSAALFYRKKWYKYFDSFSKKDLPTYDCKKWVMSSTRSTSRIKRVLNLPYKVYYHIAKNARKLIPTKKPISKTIKLCKITNEKEVL